MYRRSTLAALLLSLALPTGVFAEAGGYLAGRQAAHDHRFTEAARYFERALRENPSNASYREAAMTAQVNLGNIEAANGLVKGEPTTISALVRSVSAISAGDWAGANEAMATAPNGQPLLQELTAAWAPFGQGDVDGTLAALDEMAQNASFKALALHHKAYALALDGQLDAAAAVLAPAEGKGPDLTTRAALAKIELLAATGQTDRAITEIEARYGAQPAYPPAIALLDKINQGAPVTFTAVSSPKAAVATGYATIAEALGSQSAESSALVYARFGQHLAPEDPVINLFVASLLGALDRPDLAAENFARVSDSHPLWLGAELGRIEALDDAGNREAALSALTALATERPDNQQVVAAQAELLRRDGQLESALVAYTNALELTAKDHPSRWILLYSRGIINDQLKNWDDAESDFRAALTLSPDEPRVLNYLGYSLVERKEKLDEALAMIEQAVEAAPDNGAIVDSLGWVFFRLGRYDEAVERLERAVELEPREPVITDHFGDALWAVGRDDEARFQWRRALSFSPEDELRVRVQRKLDIGLDKVLEEEGAAPLTPAE